MSQSRKRDVYISAKGKKMILTSVLFIPLSLFFFLLHQKIGRKGRMKRLKGGQAAIRAP
jgi:hypothetical protein